MTRDQARQAGRLLGARLGAVQAEVIGGAPCQVGALAGVFGARGRDIEWEAAQARAAQHARARRQQRDARGRWQGGQA